MDSEPIDASKNTCLQQTSCLTKLFLSLDLSKAFDRVKWENLWEALSKHGASHHMLWVLQCMYYGQTKRIGDNSTDGDWFCIRGGVRQGCVLSPRLFSCVLEVALGCWRRKVGNAGMDFRDDMHTHTLGSVIRRRYPSFCVNV